jgi:hypothetical protein
MEKEIINLKQQTEVQLVNLRNENFGLREDLKAALAAEEEVTKLLEGRRRSFSASRS